jgi:hypothetical protein
MPIFPNNHYLYYIVYFDRVLIFASSSRSFEDFVDLFIVSSEEGRFPFGKSKYPNIISSDLDTSDLDLLKGFDRLYRSLDPLLNLGNIIKYRFVLVFRTLYIDRYA